MIKINIPPIGAHLHLKYTGKRVNLYEQHSTFTWVGIEFALGFTGYKEQLALLINLFDGKEIYLGILSGSIYSSKYNEWVKEESAEINYQEIILNKKFTFFQGMISIDLNLNGEIINDTYDFKIFVNGTEEINTYVLNSELEYDEFIN